MSVVRMKKDGEGASLSGGMDRVIERKTLPAWAKYAGAAAIVLLLALAWYMAPRGNTQSVQSDRLTIAEVRNGTFDDFLPLRSLVTPLLTVYLDAVEGGRVDKILVEDGAYVKK